MSDYHDKVDRARRALEDLNGLNLMPHDIRAIQSACDSLNRIQGRQVSFSYTDEVVDFKRNEISVIMEPPPQFEPPLTRGMFHELINRQLAQLEKNDRELRRSWGLEPEGAPDGVAED